MNLFGESHSQGIGVVCDGLEPGFLLDLDRLQALMDRRAPGGAYRSSRREKDQIEVLSGLFQGRTTGTPLALLIRNQDARSKDYEALRDLPRPGHADLTGHYRYGGFQDYRGGGHFSGRLTAPLCAGGGIALQILEARGIHIGAHIYKLKEAYDTAFDPVHLKREDLEGPRQRDLATLSQEAGETFKKIISQAQREGDSVGGLIEVGVLGLEPGLGDPIFSGLESRLAQMIFAIPGVKGLEFGNGFAATDLYGSQNNDDFYLAEGKIKTSTNHHGGILGGISSGMPLIFRGAIKPTPSIGKVEKTVNLRTLEETDLRIGGRHDPSIVLRALPVFEAATAWVLLDLIYGGGSHGRY